VQIPYGWVTGVLRQWRRIAAVTAVAAAMAGVALLVLMRPNPPGPVTWANAARLALGMTRAELEDVLGPGKDLAPPNSPYTGRLLGWQGDGLSVIVLLDDSGRVERVWAIKDPPESPRQRLRRRLGLD
jgi:hypothetical protein